MSEADYLQDDPNWITDWFWNILERADKDEEKLRQLLVGMDKAELERFSNEFDVAVGLLKNEPFTSHMEESEDGVDDIAKWVVSQGKTYYMRVWQHPEQLPFEPKNESYLWGVAEKIYEERYDDIPEFNWSPPAPQG